MKKLLLLTILLLPLTLFAQTEKKYLEGAITYDENQKVTFTTAYDLPQLSKEDIYQTALEWANKRFTPGEVLKPRVLYTDQDKGIIVSGGEEYMVFKSNMFTLDRTRVYYHLILTCEDHLCKAEMTRIRYWYDENRDGGEKYTAEEWISDKIALNKAKTKLAPLTGKFRSKTIDLKDELFLGIRTAMGEKLIAMGLQEAPKTQVNPTNLVAEKPVAVKQRVIANNLTTTPVEEKSNDPEAIIKQATRVTLSTGNGEQVEISKDNWGGFGEIFGKKVAFCIIDTQKTMSNLLLSQSNEYQISFYTAQSQEAALVIRCKKQMTQQLSGEEAHKMNECNDAKKTYNMYVGEVVK